MAKLLHPESQKNKRHFLNKIPSHSIFAFSFSFFYSPLSGILSKLSCSWIWSDKKHKVRGRADQVQLKSVWYLCKKCEWKYKIPQGNYNVMILHLHQNYVLEPRNPHKADFVDFVKCFIYISCIVESFLFFLFTGIAPWFTCDVDLFGELRVLQESLFLFDFEWLLTCLQWKAQK